LTSTFGANSSQQITCRGSVFDPDQIDGNALPIGDAMTGRTSGARGRMQLIQIMLGRKEWAY
jgi:hypothetical protein